MIATGATRPDDPPPPLLGRGRELITLRAAVAAAIAGRGALVLIAGAAGIGKTALAEATLAEARGQGALPLVGRAYDLSETPPYGPWSELLARASHAHDIAPPPALVAGAGGATPASQAALFAGVRDHLAALAACQPLVLLLDDLHWADPASLDLLRVVARGLPELPILLLATYRADELIRSHPLYSLLPTLVREAAATRLDLRPLDDADLRALVRRRYTLSTADEDRLATHLRDRSEGNPFYAGELLRAIEEERLVRSGTAGWQLGDLGGARVPPLLRQVLDARLDRLGEAARGTLAVAATIGQEVPLGLWAATAGTDEDGLLDAIETGVGARLLTAGGDGATIRFAHALIREALYEGILPPRRRAWHRRVADILLTAPAPDPDTVAYHLRQGGDARATEWLLRAADRAYRSYAWLSAAERVEAALVLLDRQGGDAGERGWLCVRLARLRRHGDQRQALVYAERAVTLAAEAGDAALAAYARLHRGLLRCRVGRQRAGLADLAAAVAGQEALSPEDHARLTTTRAAHGEPLDAHHDRGQLALMLPGAGRFAEAAALAEPIVADPATARGLPGAVSRFALALARAQLGRPDEARRLFAEARAQAEAAGNGWLVGQTAFLEQLVMHLPYAADRPGERVRVAREGERGWRYASGLLAADATPRLAHLVPLLLAGRWDEARALALETRAQDGINAFKARMLLGSLALARGETALAWELVGEILPDGPATEPGDTDYVAATALQRVAARLALDAGDLPLARAWLAAHDRWLTESGGVPGRAEGQLGWAAYHRAAGDYARAREYAEHALLLATTPRQPLALLAAHRLLGELATAAGRHTEPTDHLDAALALADACAAPYERALTLLALAERHTAAGRREEAAPPLAEARALLARLGAAPALARADHLALRLAGATAPAAYPDGLTPREAEVLRLLAAGRSNRAIGATLFLSPRTVQRHVANAYLKIGAHNKAEATAYVLRHGLTGQPAGLPFGLSAREAEVLRMVTEGLTDTRVSERLFISPHTVNAHLKAIYSKLGVSSRAAATRLALEHGLA